MANKPASIYTATYPTDWEARVRIPETNMRDANRGSDSDQKFICIRVREALKKDNPGMAVPAFINWDKLQLDRVSDAR